MKRYAGAAGHRPAADQPARAAPQLRHAPAQPRRRPARAADAARPQLAVDHADLHAGRARAAEAAAREAPPARVNVRPRRAAERRDQRRLAAARRRPCHNRGTDRRRQSTLRASPQGTPDEASSPRPAAAPSACPPAPRTSPPAVAAKPGAQATRGTAGRGAQSPVAAGTPDARARDAIRQINPQIRIDQHRRRADAGLPRGDRRRPGRLRQRRRQVPDAGHAVRHRRARRTSAKPPWRRCASKLLTTIPVSDRIVFAPPNPKYTVTVFTDVECGYCRKLHSEIAEYNKPGHRGGVPRVPAHGPGQRGLQEDGVGVVRGRPQQGPDRRQERQARSPRKNCKNPVTMQYDLGQRVGLTGTPMILAADGTQLGGYLPPDTAARRARQAGRRGRSPRRRPPSVGTGAGAARHGRPAASGEAGPVPASLQ